MNTKLRQKVKTNFEVFKSMNNAVFPINMENVRIHKDIKPVTAERRRNYLISEPDYAIKLFTENLLALEMRKT